MLYLFSRAFQKLWINRKTYFFIILELGIAISVVLCGICSKYSAKSKLVLCKQQIGMDGAAIEYYENGIASKTDAPISVEDYIELRETYEESEISYLLFAGSIYQTQETMSVGNVTFISMDIDSFVRYFGFAPQDDTIYLGSLLASVAANEELKFFEEWFLWGKSDVRIRDGNILEVARLESPTDTIMVGTSWDLDVRSAIILPEKFMKVLQESTDHPHSCLRVIPNVNSGGVDEVYDILETLQNIHPNCIYRVADQYAELQKSITDLTEGIRLFSWIAGFVLIISMVGIVGILLIHMEKRKRELAIIFALGGNHLTIFTEIFIEIFLLCFIGGVLGLTATVIAIPKLSTSVFTAHFQWSCIAVMIGIVLVVSIISCTCILWQIRDIYPAKILKK